MKKLFIAAVLLCCILLAACASENLTVQSDIQSLSSETVETETSLAATNSEVTASSEISKTESRSESQENSGVASRPSESKPTTASKPEPTLDEIKVENSKRAQEIIKSVTNENMSVVEKAKATYLWLYPNFKYRTSVVDLSNGYTEEVTHKLANYFFRYRKGSCEHYAAAQKVLFEELGLECYYIMGERYSYWTKKWGEHTWLMVKYNNNMYHVDGLYGGLFYDVHETTFMVPDTALKKTHRWNKDTYTPCTQPQVLK